MGVPLRGSRVGHFVRFDRFGHYGHIDQFDCFFFPSGHFRLCGFGLLTINEFFLALIYFSFTPPALAQPCNFSNGLSLTHLETCAGIINYFCNLLQNKKKFPGRDRTSPFSLIFGIILAKSYFTYLNYSLRLTVEQMNAVV